MKKLCSTSCKCNKVILARVVNDNCQRKYSFDSVLVTNNPNRTSLKHLAVITANKQVEPSLLAGKTFFFMGVDDCDQLKVGDILQLHPDGTIDVLYEAQSHHNSLFLTEQCNCSCLICPQYTVKTHSDHSDTALAIIKLIAPETKMLGITGGEPTLLGAKFLEVVRSCKQHLPNTALQVLSNGIRFSDFQFTEQFVSIGHPDIQIGIPLYADTDTQHNHMVQVKGFYKTIKGIQNLALFNQRIEIRTVVNALNYQRLPMFAEFIYRNFPFVSHIAFMGMETRECAEKNLQTVWVDPYEYSKQLESAVDILKLRNMNVSIYNSQLCVLPRSLWGFARQSISDWKNIYLSECDSCSEKHSCAGFFASGKNIHSKYIKPM